MLEKITHLYQGYSWWSCVTDGFLSLVCLFKRTFHENKKKYLWIKFMEVSCCTSTICIYSFIGIRFWPSFPKERTYMSLYENILCFFIRLPPSSSCTVDFSLVFKVQGLKWMIDWAQWPKLHTNMHIHIGIQSYIRQQSLLSLLVCLLPILNSVCISLQLSICITERGSLTTMSCYPLN